DLVEVLRARDVEVADRSPGLVGERAGEHQEVTGRGAGVSEVHVLLPWRALDHDQGLAQALAWRGRRAPDADRRNDRGGAGHRAHRLDELSLHLRSLFVLELRGGQPMDHPLVESWGNVGSAPVRRLRAAWPLMLLGSRVRRVPSRSHHADRRISRYRSWVIVEGLVPS